MFHCDNGSYLYLSFKYLCFLQVADIYVLLSPLSAIKILIYNIPKSADNIFQSILFKHTKLHCIRTESKVSSNVNYQIDFKGFFFSLKFVFADKATAD